MLAGCGGSQPPIGAPSAMQQKRTAEATSDRNVHPSSAKWFLYVGIQNAIYETQFEVYPLGGRHPVRKYSGTLGPATIAIDPWNDIYTTDNNPSGGLIAAYTPGGRSLLLEIYEYATRGLAFDTKGDLFATFGGSVVEFAPRSTKQIGIINASGGRALAFDSAGNLYVAGYHGVSVVPPGAKTPTRTITKGIHAPVALLVDRSDNLYVANCGVCYSVHHRSSVTEYAPGGDTPLRTITDGIDAPMAMAYSEKGRLFVANYGFFRRGAVTVYSSGSKPIRTITAGIRNPDALAMDPHGNLYVANCAYSKGRDSITSYAPDGSGPLLRITDGVSVCPLSIAIGKGS
jgi:sugar lactone lactonase YvrE